MKLPAHLVPTVISYCRASHVRLPGRDGTSGDSRTFESPIVGTVTESGENFSICQQAMAADKGELGDFLRTAYGDGDFDRVYGAGLVLQSLGLRDE